MKPTDEQRQERIAKAKRVALRLEKMFGRHWHEPACKALDIHRATIYRWLAGDHEISPHVYIWLEAQETTRRLNKFLKRLTK